MHGHGKQLWQEKQTKVHGWVIYTYSAYVLKSAETAWPDWCLLLLKNVTDKKNENQFKDKKIKWFKLVRKILSFQVYIMKARAARQPQSQLLICLPCSVPSLAGSYMLFCYQNSQHHYTQTTLCFLLHLLKILAPNASPTCVISPELPSLRVKQRALFFLYHD